MPTSSETHTLSTHKRINRTTLAYMAGILDGEGCIYAGMVTADGKQYPSVSITVKMTSYDLLVWIRDTFGGGLYEVNMKRITGRKPQWTWKLALPDTKWFLKLMIPLLRVKQRQARLALVLRHMIEVGKADNKKRTIIAEISRLNQG